MQDRSGTTSLIRPAIQDVRPSATLQINDRVRRLQAGGKQVYQLGFGESRFPVHRLIAKALTENVQRRSYEAPPGMTALRETIGAYYHHKFGWQVSPEQVIVGPGSKALLYTMMVALQGEVILPTPAWVSYTPQAHLSGRAISCLRLDGQDGYRLNAELIRAHLDGQVRGAMLLFSNPHNPTGTVMSPQEARGLADLACEREMIVLSDEIYMLTTHPASPRASVYDHYPQGTIVTGGLSKHLSLGGWRFGIAILPSGDAGRALAKACHTVADNIWSCVAAPVQYAAMVAYRGHAEIESYIDACARMHAARTHYLYSALSEFGASLPEPQGGYYVYPSFSRWRAPLAALGVKTSSELAHRILEIYEVATLPGSAFGDHPEALTLRLSTSYLDASTDEQAAKLVNAFAANPDPQSFLELHNPETHAVIERFAEFISSLDREL